MLGEQLPGSWTGDRLAVEYAVEVHVDIPWWPDKRVRFAVRIVDARHSIVDEQPTVYVSRVGGPAGKSPYLEFSLGQRSVHPGALLRASAALGNVEHNRYRKLRVELIAQESFPNGIGGHNVHEHAVGRWTVGIDGYPGELQPIRFSVQVPDGLIPAFELHGFRLRWFVQIQADVAWGIDHELRVPIVVQPSALEDTAVAAPQAVGSERLRLIWSKVALEHGLELDHERLQGARAEVRIEVRRDADEGALRVLGRLEFPNLGLGLRLHRERRMMLLGALETGLATRDDGHTQLLTDRIGTAITGSEYELLAADDQQLLIGFEHTGLELARLTDFVAWLVELAERVAALPAAIPMPAVMLEHADAWERGAQALGGRLCLAEPRLELERDGLRVSLACSYDDEGHLRATELTLDPSLAIPSRLHLSWSGDTPLPEHALDLRDLAAPPSWASSKRVAVHIEAERVRVFLPAPLPDPLLERERIEALLGLGRQLHGEQGPYR
jgi:hypothetical protein